MKVTLVNYHSGDQINSRVPNSLVKIFGVTPPLGLAYIAAILEKEKYDVSILDVPALNLTKKEAYEEIKKQKPDVVGVTCMSSTIKGALEAAQLAKKVGAIVVIGGSHMAAYPKEILSHAFVDYGLIGEGEHTLPLLLKAIENKTSLKNIPGLVYKKDNEIIINPGFGFVEDLDSLPIPAYHLLPIEKYNLVIALHPMITMVSSRGCPGQCGFCFKKPGDKKLRFRSPEKIVDEMEFLVKKYKIKEIVIADDNLTTSKPNIKKICNEIIKRKLNVRWEAPTRVDFVDLETLNLMRKAGCRRLRYGVESGDENTLKLMKKGVALEKIRQVFKWTKQARIESFAYFIIGYIGETEESIKKTINFAKELDPDMLMFCAATPLPDTNLYDLAISQGFVDKDYWKDYTLGKTDKRLPFFVKDTEEWVKKAYRSFYFRPKYILRMLMKIRSWHDIKKYYYAALGLLLFRMEK